ncbi:MAG: sugar phosphate isomerase/epimerase family protein [Jatrophihabitans sp.]
MTDARPLAVQLYSVRDALAADQTGSLARLAAMGFGAVEPFGVGGGGATMAAEYAATLRRDLDAAGLIARWSHVAAPLDTRTDQVLDAAEAVGLEVLVIPSPGAVPGVAGDPFDDTDATLRLGERLAEAAANAKSRGLRLAYHNHWREFSVLPDGRTAYDVLVGAAGPDVELQVDIYWAQTGGQRPAEVVAKYAPQVRSLHVKDGSAQDGVDQVAAGTGSVDLAGAIEAATAAEWHVLEIDICAGDVFDVIEAGARWAVDSGASTWSVGR